MKRVISLLKAVMSQDMDIFRYKAKKESSAISKILFPLILSIFFMTAIGSYMYMLAEGLSKLNLTYITITLAMITTTVLTLIEGIYKSQGILFEVKDNDLLFSLPIKKYIIILARIFKLLVFQYMYNLLYILPAYAIYIYFENPGALFYGISILITFLLPIIPTIVSCFIGLIVKGISSKFKAKKIIQTMLTMIIFIGVFYLSFNLEKFINTIIENATSINDMISKIYYPIGLYVQLINKFDIINLLKLLAVNIIPLILFIAISSKFYFSVISKSSEKSVINKKGKGKLKFNKKSQLGALVSKDLKKYFSSTVYMFNTLMGIVLMVILTASLCIKINDLPGLMLQSEELSLYVDQINKLIPKVFYAFIVITAFTTSITSSSISMEGKSFYISKILPASISKILAAKVLVSNIITIPVITICDIVFCSLVKIELFDIFIIAISTVTMPTLNAIIGLIVNLKYPKMDASSEAEVVKQSTSSMVAVLGGMVILASLIGLLVWGIDKYDINLLVGCEVGGAALLTIVLWYTLVWYGRKKINKI